MYIYIWFTGTVCAILVDTPITKHLLCVCVCVCVFFFFFLLAGLVLKNIMSSFLWSSM